MKGKTAKIITAAVMVAGVALWIAWDVVVAAFELWPATISRIALAWGYVNTFTPFAIGVVIGHVWWPVRKVPGYALARYIGLGVLGAVVLVLDLTVLPEVVPIVPFVFGVPVGHFVWSQSTAHMVDSKAKG